MPEEQNLIGEILLNKGLITREQFNEVLDEQLRTRQKISEILVKRGFITEEGIGRALSEQLGFLFTDLSSYQIDVEALKLIPSQAALKLEAIPLFKLGNSLAVAMTNPIDVESIDELGRISAGLRIKPVIATASGIKSAIEKYYGKAAAKIETPPFPPAEEAASRAEGEPAKLMQEAAQAPVIKLVNQLIEEAIQSGASDIHIDPHEKSLVYRLRIDGVLREAKSLPQNLHLAIISRIKIMAGMDIAQSRLPQDGRIQQNFFGRSVDLRIATFPTIYGEEIAIRILDKSQGILKLEELGFQEETLKRFRGIIYKPYGIILVTGPTGSGKTTTLYSVLNTINTFTKNIITLEDPVEYTIPNVHQSQVNVKAGLTFAMGLRSIVRLDPDIIMIGEIRDKDTAEIAVQSSLTGHLVFSTLHTNDAASAANRLLDIGVEPYLLSSSLVGILAQRLVRKLCPKCKTEYTPNREEMEIIKSAAGDIAVPARFYKAGSCKDCKNTGYKGRVGIFELITPDEEIKELISRRAPAYEIKSVAVKSGMKTLREDGLEKVVQGITSLSEVLRVTQEA